MAPAEISQLASETRSPKLREISTPAVRQYQRSQLSPSELFALKSLKRQALMRSLEQGDSKEPTEMRMQSNWRALTQARDHLYERHSVLKGHQILAESLNQSLGSLDLERLKLCLASTSTGMTRLAESPRNPLLSCQWASNRGLELERWSVEFVNQTQRSCSPLGSTQKVEFDFKSEEQRSAVLEALQNTDRVYAIRGCAGAGKTTCLQEIQKGLEAVGRNAHYLAPTAARLKCSDEMASDRRPPFTTSSQIRLRPTQTRFTRVCSLLTNPACCRLSLVQLYSRPLRFITPECCL